MAYPQTAFSNTTFSISSFISRRRDVVYSNTLLYQLNVLKSTGRYDAFKLGWHPSYNDKPDVWPVPNHLFWDSVSHIQGKLPLLANLGAEREKKEY
jgi:hypothetical protein